MKMLDMQKLKVKGKHFVYPLTIPLPPPPTHTQARRLSQKVPDKMQSAAVSGEETEREKTEGDWFDSLARRCVGVSAPGTLAGGRGGSS